MVRAALCRWSACNAPQSIKSATFQGSVIPRKIMANDKGGSPKSKLLEKEMRDYAAVKERDLSFQMQELSVAKFEIDHLPGRREVYLKRGSLLFLTPRGEARATIEAKERHIGKKLASMEEPSFGSPK